MLASDMQNVKQFVRVSGKITTRSYLNQPAPAKENQRTLQYIQRSRCWASLTGRFYFVSSRWKSHRAIGELISAIESQVFDNASDLPNYMRSMASWRRTGVSLKSSATAVTSHQSATLRNQAAPTRTMIPRATATFYTKTKSVTIGTIYVCNLSLHSKHGVGLIKSQVLSSSNHSIFLNTGNSIYMHISTVSSTGKWQWAGRRERISPQIYKSDLGFHASFQTGLPGNNVMMQITRSISTAYLKSFDLTCRFGAYFQMISCSSLISTATPKLCCIIAHTLSLERILVPRDKAAKIRSVVGLYTFDLWYWNAWLWMSSRNHYSICLSYGTFFKFGFASVVHALLIFGAHVLGRLFVA